MSRKKRYIKLEEAERKELEKGYKQGKSPVTRRKCQGILLSDKGQTVSELSVMYEVRTRTIYDWFNDWERGGIKGVELKSGRGRKPKLKIEDGEQVKLIKKLVENKPQNLRGVVKELKTDLGIDLSKKTLKRFLKKNLNIVGNAFESE
jgi:transposase